MMSGSYKRTDGHRPNRGFGQLGGYAKVGYQFSETWNAFADLSITHFNASNPGTVNRPIYDNDSHITRGMTSFSIENNYNRTSGALKFFYNWGKHKINDGYYEGGDPRDYLFHSKDKMLGINWYQSATFWTGSRITAGFDFQQFGGKAWNAFLNGDRSYIINKTAYNVAGYLDYRQNLWQIYKLDAGVSLDHHSVKSIHIIPYFGP